jgi:hypothetical protein
MDVHKDFHTLFWLAVLFRVAATVADVSREGTTRKDSVSIFAKGMIMKL